MAPDDLYLKLASLVERSEERAEKLDKMVASLNDTCRINMEIYDRHLTSLESSRDQAQQNSYVSIETLKSLTIIMENMRDDYRTHLDALRDELHRLRDEYIEELQDIRKGYKELAASYRRLAERVAGSPKAEVKISQ